MNREEPSVAVPARDKQTEVALWQRHKELLRAGLTQVVDVDINGYFKHIHPSGLGEIDPWLRMRLRSILRKRRGGRGRGEDHHRWPNRYFTGLGLFCLLDAKVTEAASLRQGANH